MTNIPSILPPAAGGTGIKNSANITLGGALTTANSFTTVGNFAATFTFTGATNVTFPTSGTLGTGTIGGSTGATDKAILSANGTGGATLQATGLLYNANSQFVVPGGTSSLPSIAISGSLGTGFYSDATNNLKLTINTTQIITFASGGITTFGNAGIDCADKLVSRKGIIVAVRTVAGDITGASSDYILAVSSTASARTVTVPNSSNTNQIYIIKDTSGGAGTNNITITTPGGVKTFDGATSITISTNYGSVRLYYDGTNYFTW